MKSLDSMRKQETKEVQCAYSRDYGHIITNYRKELWIYLEKNGKSLKDFKQQQDKMFMEKMVLKEASQNASGSWAGER